MAIKNCTRAETLLNCGQKLNVPRSVNLDHDVRPLAGKLPKQGIHKDVSACTLLCGGWRDESRLKALDSQQRRHVKL